MTRLLFKCEYCDGIDISLKVWIPQFKRKISTNLILQSEFEQTDKWCNHCSRHIQGIRIQNTEK